MYDWVKRIEFIREKDVSPVISGIPGHDKRSVFKNFNGLYPVKTPGFFIYSPADVNILVIMQKG